MKSKSSNFLTCLIAFVVSILLFIVTEEWEEVTRFIGLDSEKKAVSGTRVFLEVCWWLLVAYIANYLIRAFVWDGLVKRSMGRPVPSVLKQIGSVLVAIVAAGCIAAFVFGQSVAAFLATLGAGGVVLGFALRNLLSDLFTGLAVNFDDNFVIGDWLVVQSSSGSSQTVGQVEEIGWRCTRLTTEEGTTVVVPNSLLGLEKVVNISRPIALTRYEVVITMDYSIPVERARRVLDTALRSVVATDGFSKEKEPQVLIDKTGELGVSYLLRYWIIPWKPLSPRVSRDRVMTAVLRHLQTAGITPAYPKTDIFHARMPTRHVQGHTQAGVVALLARIPIFYQLEDEELERVASELSHRKLSVGETLFRSGEEGDSLFILIEGLLEVWVDLDQNDTAKKVGQLNPGEFFGELAMLTGEPRSATIVAHTDATVYEIKRATVIGLIEARPEISEQISRVVAERQLNLDRARADRTDEAVEERVRSFTRQIVNKMMRFFKG